MTELPDRPYTILLYTMGGQGGAGVEPMASKGGRILCNWIVHAARAAGYPVQSTLTPGTGQRTGLNSLYLEICPADAATLGGRKPVFRLGPRQGDVDLVIAYELLEAGRVLSQGFVSKERTTLVGSTHRFFTTAEKVVTTDGRVDPAPITAAVTAGAKRTMLFDMAETSAAAGGSVNAVALGAIAALESFPVDAVHLEQAVTAIPDGLNGAAENLAAFAAGQSAATNSDPELTHDSSSKRRRRPVAALDKRVAETFSGDVRSLIQEGVARVADFQSVGYAKAFLDRVDVVHRLDDGGPAGDHVLTRETARYLALWMSYDDIIRIADLKTRRERLTRIRTEVGIDPQQPLRITEYFNPGLDEWTAVLPVALGRSLRTLATRAGLRHRLNMGLHIRSTAIWGYLLLRFVANLRFLRPASLGLAEKTKRIERWLSAIQLAADRDYRLAVEIAECGRLIKGYGETRARGYEKFERVFEKLIQPSLEGWLSNDHAAPAIGKGRLAAFADPDGETFEAKLDEIAAAANVDVAAAETGSATF